MAQARLLQSLLKEVIDSLPLKTKIKGQSVINTLKKRGVKDEEFKFAQLDALDPQKAYTKDDLIGWEATRKDTHGTIESDQYRGTTTHNEPDVDLSYDITPDRINELANQGLDTSYKSRVTTVQSSKTLTSEEKLSDAFGFTDTDDTRGSIHFTGSKFKDYLFHSRVYDDKTLFNKPTRVVLEIQSDTHQQLRKKAKTKSLPNATISSRNLLQDIDEQLANKDVGFDDKVEFASETVMETLVRSGLGPDDPGVDEVYAAITTKINEFANSMMDKDKFTKVIKEAVDNFNSGKYSKVSDVSEAPHSKTWSKKALEQEIVIARQEGQTQIAVPIKAGGDISRITNVTERLFEDIAMSDLTKVDFKRILKLDISTEELDVVIRYLNTDEEEVAFKYIQKLVTDATPTHEISNLARSEGVQKWYETSVSPTLKKLAKQSNSTFKTETKDGIEYAVIEFTPKTDTSKFKLYSATGGLLGSAGLGMDSEAQAMGIQDDQIKAAKEQGFTEDEIKTAMEQLNAPPADLVKQATEQGFSSEEIDLAWRQLRVGTKDLSEAEFKTPGEGFTKQIKQPDKKDPLVELTGSELGGALAKEAISTLGILAGNVKSFGFNLKAKDIQTAEEEKFVYNPLDRQTVIDRAKELGEDPTSQAGINAIYQDEKKRLLAFEEEEGAKAVEAFADMQGLEGSDRETYIARRHIERKKKNREAFAEAITPRVANLQELANVDTPWQWIKANSFGDTIEAEREYAAIQRNNVELITQMAAERGLNLQYQEGMFFAENPNGEMQRIEPGMLEAMGKSKYEIVGGVGGAFAGPMAASKYLGAKGKLIGLGASVVGSTIGAVVGDQIDYLQAAMEAQEDLDSKVALEKAIGTAQFTVIADVLGYGIFKGLAKTGRGIGHVYQFIKDGNTKGAYQALKETLGNISDDEAQEIVTRWEKLNQMEAPGKNIAEKTLAIGPTTAPGGEAVIAASAATDPSMSRAVINEVNTRAQTLLKASRKGVDVDNGKELLNELNTYTNAVKTQYDVVKKSADNAVRTSYKFNFPKLGIQPLLEHKIATITDPIKVDSLTRIMEKVERATTGRSFSDLIDTYKVVNGFKYNKRIFAKEDFNAINETLATVKNEIKKQAQRTKKGTKWYSDWLDANKAYSTYKKLEENVLFKAINKPGVTEDTIAKQFIKYANSIDSSYKDVMSKLPAKRQRLVENSIMDQTINKFTKGDVGGFKVIDFPALAEDLNKYGFNSPEAARLKTVINKMAEVYRNDIKLAAASGKIELDGFQSYLTTDPVVRAKFEAASGIFNYIKTMLPGKKADMVAMVNKTAKLLENPLNAKTTQQVIESVKDDAALVAQIKRMQKTIAKGLQDGTEQQPTKAFKDKKGNLYYNEGKGRTLSEFNFIPHRTINASDLNELLKVKKFKRSDLTTKVKLDLLKKGINTIQMPNGQLIQIK